ncbi:GNAT family N-acetyltransferase [Anaerobacillus isosaccharinicus]|uniref:GNAT family N-acetyltransferase n=1 Tax=Anaerobacillus isosaccharinicus TaxID=1532552 RepID=A0A1S2L7R8_9BACI|nr:GNAT family N-acetyltransferase [Anaerobacillus isosaccharinicus]MBA5587654.1 GNAT family N-acetyltransferase [Anaerobacillus isosaccharinicus]QOY34173.1 GNAT family N-acetyltransferase [Anaerobacillus isosaccharinicus]
MDWYEKLNQYFPIEEMKSQKHMELLLQEKGDIYHKDEGQNHVMMYVEMDDFIFIDYLFVSKEARGQGLGKKLLNKLKKKEKPIILEVEPVDYEETDTQKRLKFYEREGFHHAKSIGYRRRSLATNEITELEILYWSPDEKDEESIFQKMKKTYETIHTYKDEEMYGERYENVDEVLSFKEEET